MSSIIKTHVHLNYDILKEFTESANSVLLYKGKPIVATSKHETLNINTQSGVHGLRFHDEKLQYYDNGIWNDIATHIEYKDIIISLSANNALKKYSNGYYVQEFLISPQINNAIKKYSDGYYVPAIPANNATTDDINVAVNEINKQLAKQSQTFNERYNLITQNLYCK